MLKSMMVSAAAFVSVTGAALLAGAPAQAQGVGIEIGSAGVRAFEQRSYRPVVERRERRMYIQNDDDEVCHTEVRRRRTASGSVIVRRVRVCE